MQSIFLRSLSMVKFQINQTWGNDVAYGTMSEKLTPGDFATPWRASFHHWYAESPIRGTEPAVLPNRDICVGKIRSRIWVWCARASENQCKMTGISDMHILLLSTNQHHDRNTIGVINTNHHPINWRINYEQSWMEHISIRYKIIQQKSK